MTDYKAKQREGEYVVNIPGLKIKRKNWTWPLRDHKDHPNVVVARDGAAYARLEGGTLVRVDERKATKAEKKQAKRERRRSKE